MRETETSDRWLYKTLGFIELVSQASDKPDFAVFQWAIKFLLSGLGSHTEALTLDGNKVEGGGSGRALNLV